MSPFSCDPVRRVTYLRNRQGMFVRSVRGLCSLRGRSLNTYVKCTSDFEALLYKSSFNTAEVFKIRDILSKSSFNPSNASSIDRWKANAQTLLEYVEPRHLKKILTYGPEVLNLCPVKLRRNVHALQSTRGSDFKYLAIDCPAVLAKDSEEVLGRLQSLQEIFPRKQIFRLINKNMSLLTEPVEEIQDRYRYLTMVMGQDQKDMIDSSALNFTTSHIRLRHLIAEWAGVFKPVPMKLKMAERKKRKPNLVDLVCTSDEEFCRSVVGIGIDEYAAFSDMLEMGLLNAVGVDVGDEEEINSD